MLRDSRGRFLPARQTVESLVSGAPVRHVELLVLRCYPHRTARTPNYTGTVAAACARDETGIVGMVLWGDDARSIIAGDVVRITDGWCRRNHGELVVSAGTRGTLEVVR